MCGCHCHPSPSTLEAILSAVLRLEASMATTAERITELSGRFDTLSTNTSDLFNDFVAFRDRVQADLAQAIADRNVPTAEVEASLAEFDAKIEQHRARLGELDVEIGDADGSDTPVNPDQPGEGEQPVDTGDPNTNA